MVRKGDATRERIVARAAEVFNLRGVAGTSVADVMAATGLKKGGIYNHFESKEQLALEAFDYAAGVLDRRFAPVWATSGLETLTAFIDTFRSYTVTPPLPGGCPVLNTAIESDDTHPLLQQRARAVTDDWQARLTAAITAGQERHEIRRDIDAEALATVIIATLEGGLMLSQLRGEPMPLERAAEHLADYIRATAAA